MAAKPSWDNVPKATIAFGAIEATLLSLIRATRFLQELQHAFHGELFL